MSKYFFSVLIPKIKTAVAVCESMHKNSPYFPWRNIVHAMIRGMSTDRGDKFFDGSQSYGVLFEALLKKYVPDMVECAPLLAASLGEFSRLAGWFF